MPHLRDLKNIAFGMLGSFVGRYNSIEGYWALGRLYREGLGGDGVIRLHLLEGRTEPATPINDAVMKTYLWRLDAMMEKRGLTRADIVAADIVIAFNTSDSVRAWTGCDSIAQGEPYRCTVTITDRRHTPHQASHVARCRPHDPTRESRSAR
jgi:hypothetical protein